MFQLELQPTKREAPTAGSGWSSFSSLSTLPDRVFSEDLLDSLERFFGRGLRRHPVLHDVGPAGWPDMLVLHLCIGRIECPVICYGRAGQRLGRVGFPMRVGEPPRVAFDDRRHARNVAAEPGLQVLVDDRRLDQIFEEFLGHFDILRPLRDQRAKDRHRPPQACTIGYFAKIASQRLNALSIAASGVIPLLITSFIAMANTCSVLTSALAGLDTS